MEYVPGQLVRGDPARRRADRRPSRSSTSSSRPAAASTTPTATASCTATSSRGTSCVTPDGIVKLADFGIAKARRAVGHHPGRLRARHRRLPRARAGPRRGGRARRRPLRARRRHLPAHVRPAPLRGDVADRARASSSRTSRRRRCTSSSPEVPPAALGRRGVARWRWTPRSATPAPRRWRAALGDGLRGVFPERGRGHRRHEPARRRGRDRRHAHARGAARAPRRPCARASPAGPRPPVEPVEPPAVRDRDAAAADRRRQRDQPPEKRRRWIALLLVLLVIGAGIAAAIVLTNQSNAVKRRPGQRARRQHPGRPAASAGRRQHAVGCRACRSRATSSRAASP